MKNNLLKKFVSFSYGSWIGLILGILITIFTTRIISPEDFGKASLFLLAMNIFMIFIVFGTDQAFIRFFYEEIETHRKSLLFNCLIIPTGIAVFISFGILIFNSQITLFLFGEENIVIAGMLILGILAKVLHRFGTLLIRMQQKGNLFSILEILDKLFNLVILVLLFLFIGPSFEIIIYSTVIALLILTAVAIFTEKSYWNLKKARIGPLNNLAQIINYGYPLVITILITWLFQSFDKIALRQWSSFEELGLYAGAFKIIALLSILQTTFSNFWTPVCYENFQKDPENKLLYRNMSRIVAFIMFFVAILTIVLKDFIILLLGQEYSSAANIMPFLVFIPLMYTVSETTVIGINFYKKPKMHVLIALVSCIVNIIGNWILVPEYGAIGASFSTGLSCIVFFSLRTMISLKYYKVNYGLKNVYIMILVLSIFALYSITNTSLLLNSLFGIFTLLILLILYSKDLIQLFRTYKK